MNLKIWIPALLLAVSGVAQAAKTDLDYARLRASLNDLAADPVLGKLAPAERALAEQAVQAVGEKGGNGDEHTHLVYLAERRVDIAYATAQAIDQERRLDKLDREHDQILLAASRHDAEQARLEAEKQRIQSLAQAEEAERLRAEADAARAQGEMSAQDAANARKQAEQTKRLADAQAKEAALSRKEAQLLAEAAAADARSRPPAPPAAAAATGTSRQMVLNDSAFAPGAATLRPEARSNVSAIVAFVNRDKSKQIRIEGHTDNGGSANADLVLSQRRAEAVRDALVGAGVDKRRITTFGMGQAQPVAPNTTEEGRAKNRRVDVMLEDR
jgi:outer membrane protein OmpA-like peptidoglycan-associated protein